jgi:hypothetical protein
VQQNEKRGLEGVVPIRILVQEALTHTAHHRPVAAHQGAKSGFIMLVSEARKEFLIARFSLGGQPESPPPGQLPNVPHHPL